MDIKPQRVQEVCQGKLPVLLEVCHKTKVTFVICVEIAFYIGEFAEGNRQESAGNGGKHAVCYGTVQYLVEEKGRKDHNNYAQKEKQ